MIGRRIARLGAALLQTGAQSDSAAALTESTHAHYFPAIYKGFLQNAGPYSELRSQNREILTIYEMESKFVENVTGSQVTYKADI